MRRDSGTPILETPTGKPRARALGIPFAGMTGANNALTDVPGVEVGYATLIEGDDVTLTGDHIDDPRIPVVERARQVDEEDDRDAALRSQFTVGEGDSVRAHMPGRRLRV